VLTVIATLYLGIILGKLLASFVVDCTIESIGGIPIKWGLTAVGVSYLFASSEKVLKLAFTFVDYIKNPDKRISLHPDCTSIALIVAYLTLLAVAFADARSCEAGPSNITKDVVYLAAPDKSSTVQPLEWIPFFFKDLAKATSPEAGTTLTSGQRDDLTRILGSLRACVGSQPGEDVEIAVKGFADTNQFPTNSAELNRQVANRRAAQLHGEIKGILRTQTGPAAIKLAESYEWPKETPFAMFDDRYFDTRPLTQTGKQNDQGLFNRRADLLILSFGVCRKREAR
jgi:hypothetical protein